MTNLAHYRYLILVAISFLLASNSPVHGVTIAGIRNLAQGQSVYWDNTPLSVFSYFIAGVLFVASIGTIIYILFFMKKSDKKGS